MIKAEKTKEQLINELMAPIVWRPIIIKGEFRVQRIILHHIVTQPFKVQ
jgi:hypothetical protein